MKNVYLDNNLPATEASLLGKYRIVYADPPWPYNTWGTPEGTIPNRRKVGRGMAEAIYTLGVMSLDRIKEIGQYLTPLLTDDAFLALWCTGPHLVNASSVASAWGFPYYSTQLFVWQKSLVNDPPLDADLNVYTRKGLGYWTMSSTETVLLFRKSKSKGPKKHSNGIPQTYYHKIMQHSEKPLWFSESIERLFGPQNILELFARRYTQVDPVRKCYRTSLGVELDGLDITDSLTKLSQIRFTDTPFIPKGVSDPIESVENVKHRETQLKPEGQVVQNSMFDYSNDDAGSSD